MVRATEAARLLGCSRQRVHQLVKRGLMAGEYRSKHLYIPIDEVNRRAAAVNRDGALLTVDQAAARLGVTPRQIYRWEKKGKLAAVRTTTRRILFDPAVLDAFVPRIPGRNPK